MAGRSKSNKILVNWNEYDGCVFEYRETLKGSNWEVSLFELHTHMGEENICLNRPHLKNAELIGRLG